MKRGKLILSAAIIATVLGVSGSLYALREVIDNSATDLSPIIKQENLMKQQIISEKKNKEAYTSQSRISKPIPKAYPMPSKAEMKKTLPSMSNPMVPVIPAPVASRPSSVLVNDQAAQAREKAFDENEGVGRLSFWLPGVALLILLFIGIFFLLKKPRVKNERGNALILAIGILFVVFAIGASLVYVTQNESQKTAKSSKGNSALYVADAGVEKAMWELNRDSGYSGENATSLGDGQFTVTVSTPGGAPNQRSIFSIGKVGAYTRKIKVTSERFAGNISVDSALACGGNVSIGGNAHINGGSLTGVLVPVGSNVTTFGGGTASGTPPTGNAPFPSFEDVFGLTQAQLQGFATTRYTNPPNNVPCDGITWIDGNFHVTAGWVGTGILIVNGNLDMNGGGNFTGVIYVTGSFHMAGHAAINGSILTQSMADVAAILGTADIIYDSTAISGADNLYPFKIIAWQEVK